VQAIRVEAQRLKLLPRGRAALTSAGHAG